MKFIRENIAAISSVLAVLTAVMMALSVYMVFSYAPLERVMGWPQKIFYFHVPIAIACYIGFFVTFAGSIGYLWTKNIAWDRFAVAGAEVGIVFATLMLLTGMIWGKPIWGAYWTWDPRLTTSFILWLIFVGYLILRTRVDDEIMRAKYAAVMGIVGYADVPLVHWSVKLWSRGIHPVLEKTSHDSGMHPDMFTAFQVCLISILLLFVLIFIQRVRYEFLKAEVDYLKSAHS
ncbi:Cytochrome c-type biogenesis protein CcmC, putative heme lyase for CcmE [hydrothermal vent metagenome]|uniref:Cytochrome c-type biogenesis protein CcmC, putative heme lyase for CcmE n=1 Tax=hydrothermal vent metagenome TaxID=652676 RepID=A0A3B1BN91_9ZZZZ